MTIVMALVIFSNSNCNYKYKVNGIVDNYIDNGYVKVMVVTFCQSSVFRRNVLILSKVMIIVMYHSNVSCNDHSK